MEPLSEQIVAVFPGKKILILGDLVADQFLRGTIARVSREAPVFILRHDETETRAGAAANAAVNAASLGANPVLVGVIGPDENGRLLTDRLEKDGVDTAGIVADNDVRTTTKVRVLAGQHYAARQQVIRIDYEPSRELNSAVRGRLLEQLDSAGRNADAIIISDYGYGVADQALFVRARSIAHERGIPLLVDSRHRLGQFRGATAATPNQEEVEELAGSEFSAESGLALRKQLEVSSLLVTRGNKGMVLFEEGHEPLVIPAAGSTEPVDVTGAGDTVIAVYSLGLASGLSCRDAAEAANHAGGIVVMKKGTAAVTLAELSESLRPNARPNTLEFTA